MLRQSSSRSHRVNKLRPRHSFQVFLFAAVGIWLLYQLAHLYGKRRAVIVDADDGSGMDGGKLARRRLGRKGFVGFVALGSDDDIDGGDYAGRGAGWSDDPLSQAGDHGDVDEEELEEDEDDGVDDADDGLAADEEEGETDFLSEHGGGENGLNNRNDETGRASELGNGDDGTERLHQPSQLNSSAVPHANTSGRLQDGVADLLVNATDAAAADGIAIAVTESAVKNTSSADVALHDTERAGDVAKKLLANFGVGAPVAEKPGNNLSTDENRMINQNGTADSVKGHGISS